MDLCVRLERLLSSEVFWRNPVEAWGEIDEMQGIEQCIVMGLERHAHREDWLGFGAYVIAASRKPSKAMASVLNSVLERRIEDVNNEDIVEVLGDIADPSSVAVLSDTIWWSPDWDEFHGLSVKCVWALASIGSSEAVEALGVARSVGPEEVREAAAHELRRLQTR